VSTMSQIVNGCDPDPVSFAVAVHGELSVLTTSEDSMVHHACELVGL